MLDESSEDTDVDNFNTDDEERFSNLLETPKVKREKTKVELDVRLGSDSGSPLP